jgi:hypothetical protein
MEGVHPNSPVTPAVPAPGAASRPDGEVCDCLNPMCSHRSARPAAPAVEADLRAVKAIKLLEAIQVRCREGDPRSNWLPIIDGLATEAVAALRGAGE